MAYTKTTWVNDQQPDIDADNLNKMEQGIYDAQFPDGGVSGQLLSKTINGTEWVDAPNSAVWGLIQGTLSDQTDLAYALENTGKVDSVNGIEPDVNKNVQVDIELTKAQYDALPSSKLTDDINYYIKDGTNIPQASVISADGVMYTNSQTVKGALDEVKNGLSNEIIVSSSVSYYSFGSLVVAVLAGFTISGDRVNAGLPAPKQAVIFNARDIANGNLATLWFDGNGIRTYKAVNFTDGNAYVATFIYAKA